MLNWVILLIFYDPKLEVLPNNDYDTTTMLEKYSSLMPTSLVGLSLASDAQD